MACKTELFQLKNMLFAAIAIPIFLLSLIESTYSDDDMDDYRKNEKAAIQATGGRVERLDDKRLRLKLKTGKKIILADRISYSDDIQQMRYVFRGVDSKLGGYLFDIWYWEDYDILLIRLDDGTSRVIPDVPIYSPGKTRFICIEDSPLYNTEIHLFRIGDSEVEEEFVYSPDDQGAENPRWLNDAEVAIDLYRYRRDAKGKEIKDIAHIQLLREANIWTIKNENKRR